MGRMGRPRAISISPDRHSHGHGGAFNSSSSSSLHTFIKGCFLPGMVTASAITDFHVSSPSDDAATCPSQQLSPTSPGNFEEDACEASSELAMASFPLELLSDDLLTACLARVSRLSLGSALKVCQRWRYLLQSIDYRQARSSLGNIDSYLAVISSNAGPSRDMHPVLVQLYHSQSDTWQQAGLPDKLMAIDDFSSCCAVGEKLYIFGGVIGSCRSDPPVVYDMWTNSVHRIRHMNSPRTRFVVGNIKGKIYVAGGLRGSLDAPTPDDANVDELMVNLANVAALTAGGLEQRPRGSREQLPDGEQGEVEDHAQAFQRVMNFARDRGSRRRQLAVFTQSRDLRSAEVYDPATDMWQGLPKMTHARVGCVGGAVGGKLFVIGGSCKVHLPLLQERLNHNLEIFDPETNTWTLKDPVPRIGFILSSVILGRSIYIMRSDANKLSWLKYDTEADSWTPLHSVPLPTHHRLTHLVKFECATAGNKIYVVQMWGGVEDVVQRPRGLTEGALVLEYDPEMEGSAAWRRVSNMPVIARGGACTGVGC